MLKYRILTALVLIPLVILAIFYLPRPWFAGICTLITLLAAWEWAPLFGWQITGLKITFIAIILIGLIAALFIKPLIVAIGSIWWMLVFVWIIYLRIKNTLITVPRWTVAVMGFLALIPCWLSLVLLQVQPILLLLLLLLVWSTDTAAYFGGKAFGKRKLAPSISPNKTFEGMLCGIAAGLTIALIGQLYLGGTEDHQLKILNIALPTILASIIGDLFESLLKRMQGVKDSGQILPGHGGLLDRIDSLLAAAPVFVCGVLAQGLL